jgi:hypothetical protein
VELIDRIIDLLSGDKPNLTEALVKTKVLLYKLGRQDLSEWVNNELNGYPADSPVPEYRVVTATVKGNLVNIAWSMPDQPLPTMHLEKKWRERFVDLKIRESIASIEQLAAGNTSSGRLTVTIPPEAHELFEKAIQDFHIQRAWSEIGHGAMTGIVTAVRSRLLDFVLELGGRVRDIATDEDLRRVGAAPEITKLFNNMVLGDHATVMVGNYGHQHVISVNAAGDFAGLSKLLSDHGVSEADILALRNSIEADRGDPSLSKGDFGKNVRAWLGSMFQKAVDTSWAIELGIVGNLLTDALKSYYGWLRF